MSARLRPRRPRAALAAAATTAAVAAALLPAPPAVAADPGLWITATYRATFTATIAYDHDRSTDDGTNVSSEHAEFAVTLRAPAVTFDNGLLVTPVAIPNVTVTAARSSRSETAEDIAKRCSGTSVLSTAPASMLPTRAARPAAPPTTITVVPFLSAALFMSCTDKQGNVFDETIELGNVPPGGRRSGAPFDVELQVPREDVGRERLIFTPPSQAKANLESCPFKDVDTTTCIAGVRNPKLVLDLIESDAGDLLAPLGPIKPTITRGARRAQTRATCKAGCRIRIRVFLPRGRLGRASAAAAPVAAAAARALAERRLTLKPSPRPQLVTLPLGAAARAAAKRAGGLRLELTLDPPAGRTVTRSALAPLAR